MAVERDVEDLRGVLHRPGAGAFVLRRWDPAPALAPYVSWFWAVAWDLRGRPPHVQATLSHPSVHLAVGDGGALVHGPPTERFEQTLAGRGHVVAVRFAAGAARPFVDRPVRALTGREVPAAEVVPGLDVEGLVRSVEAAGEDLDAGVAALEAALVPLVPAEVDAAVARARRAVELLGEDRSLVRVADLAARLGLSPRSVQRLFAEHVGVGPAWVVRRARLQDAAARATSGEDVDWARLAAELGYYDQAHLVREFTATVGAPPARYAARGRSSRPSG